MLVGRSREGSIGQTGATDVGNETMGKGKRRRMTMKARRVCIECFEGIFFCFFFEIGGWKAVR